MFQFESEWGDYSSLAYLDKLFNLLKFNIMRVFKTIKKAIKWYFNWTAKIYMIPS